MKSVSIGFTTLSTIAEAIGFGRIELIPNDVKPETISMSLLISNLIFTKITKESERVE